MSIEQNIVVPIRKFDDKDLFLKSVLLIEDKRYSTSSPRAHFIFLGKVTDADKRKMVWRTYFNHVIDYDNFETLTCTITDAGLWLAFDCSKACENLTECIFWSSFCPFRSETQDRL